MLQNHLKTELPSEWRNLFKHHESYPEDYYDVAEVELNSGEKKILVLNRETDDLMEYYYDDIPDNQWIDLEKFFKFELIDRNENFKKLLDYDLSNIYFINKYGAIQCNYKGKVRKSNLKNKISNRRIYPERSFSLFDISIYVYNHSLIAYLFIPNLYPEVNNIINHKDLNPLNFCKENLEWITYSENNKAENRLNNFCHKYKYLQIDPKDKKVIKEWYNASELKKYFPGYRKVLCGIRITYKGYEWKRIDLTLEDYKSRHPVIENGWYLNPFITSHKVEANLCGILKINGVENIGTLEEKEQRYRIKIGGKSILVHRLVYETISGKKIEENNVIDHIQPVRSVETINNEYSNLREVTQKENMNNPETLSYRKNK